MKTRLNVPVVRPKGLLVDLDDTIVSDSDCAAAVWAAAVEAAAGVIPIPVDAVRRAIERERPGIGATPSGIVSDGPI